MKHAIVGLALLTLLLLPVPAGAQEAAIVRIVEDPAWIGISYQAGIDRAPGPGGAPPRFVVLTRVWEGSPAAEAGLERGDTILTVNGAPASDEAFRRLDLEPGDQVSMTLRRGGSEEELTLTAAQRPELMGYYGVSPEQRVRIDSVQNAIVRFMEDSARVTLRAVPFRFRVGQGREVEPLLLDVDSIRSWTLMADSLGAVFRGEGPGFDWFRFEGGESTFPFSAFVARSEATDSILRQMRELRAELEEARRAELQRQRELAESLAEEQRRIDQTDEELRRTRRLQEELRTRLARTQEALERESRRALLARSARVRTIPGDTLRATVHQGTSHVDARIPAPHVVGRTVVAGAQLLPLNEGLGQYFGTEEGVLVTEVVPGSPVEAAGIEPGDVIVSVGGVAVRGVPDVREGLGDPGSWPVELTLLRKGRRLTVRLTR